LPGEVVVRAPQQRQALAAPPGSYEALVAHAEVVEDLGRMLEPFTEKCTEERDMTRRQCEVVRAYLRRVLERRVFVSGVEGGSLVVGPYEEKSGGRTLVLYGCLACKRPVAGDVPLFLVADAHDSKTKVKEKAVRPSGLPYPVPEVARLVVAHPSQHVAETWQAEVGSKLRAELVFRLGRAWQERLAGRKETGQGRDVRGLFVHVVGYRVYDRCTGDVLLASPQVAFKASVARAQPDCPKREVKVAASQPAARQPDPSWPYVLSVGDIRRTMDSIRGQVRACYLQFQIPGSVELEVEVGGMDGNVLSVRVGGKFEETPTGDCVTAAVSAARFPRFRAASMKVPYRFYLQ